MNTPRPPGSTTTVRMPAIRPDGSVEVAEFFTVINASTHPQEGARLLQQAASAVPFVYHDPSLELFVLVVPPVLAHRALLERADLLKRLHAYGERMPAYMVEATMVVGSAALRSLLNQTRSGSRSGPPQSEPPITAVKAPDQAAMEQVRHEQEIAWIAIRDKERELSRRLAELAERESALVLVTDAEIEPAIGPPSNVELVVEDVSEEELVALDMQMEEEPTRVVDTAAFGLTNEMIERMDSAEFDALDEINELSSGDVELTESDEEDPADESSEETSNNEDEDDAIDLSDDDAIELSEDDAIDEVDVLEDDVLEDDVLEDDVLEDDADDLETISGNTLDVKGEDIIGLEAPLRSLELRRHPEEGELPADAVDAPDSFLADSTIQMMAVERKEDLWLFVRLSEGEEDVFEDNTELLVQYVAPEDRAVILLCLVDFSSRPYPRRAALDPRGSADGAYLRALGEGKTARVALFSARGRYRRQFEVALGDRIKNMEIVLERAAKTKGRVEASIALERALAAAPPVQLKGHPFGEGEAPTTAKQALKAVASLTTWAQPQKRDLALLALSIPFNRVEAGFERVLQGAAEFGICLPDLLMSRAVAMGVAAEPGEYVMHAITMFQKTLDDKKRSGLNAVEVGKNWEALLARASEYELAVDARSHERAIEDIALGRGDSLAPPKISKSELPELDDETLYGLADHPRMRLGVALELLSRGEETHLRRVSLSLRRMPREEVLEVSSAMLAKGEVCVDGFIDGLGAKKTFVRQACALALGELGLRRSVGPLVQLLQTEPTEVWIEVARVLGSFGAPVMRNLERAIKHPRGPKIRFSYVLAHLLEADGSLQDLLSDAESIKDAVAAVPTAKADIARLAADNENAVQQFSQLFRERLPG